MDVADEFMNDPSETCSDEVESGGKQDADENSDDAAAAPNAKKVRARENFVSQIILLISL